MSFLQLLLYPFSIAYDLVMRFRNYLFDVGYKTSFSFQTNVIGVGNLTVGGTGKTPMVEYLIRLLSDENKIATLSRGYGRETKGFRLANEGDSAKTIGDEPFQFYRKFKNIKVAVGEERAVAIPQILADEAPDIILMDDSYQHRYVKPSVNILLSDYNRPFYKDFVLPAGRLRESRIGAKRANAVIITKCPKQLNQDKMEEIEGSISHYTNSTVYFSTLEYMSPEPVQKDLKLTDNVLLFAGLANNKPVTEHVSEHYNLIDDFYFSDHHVYTTKDLNLIEERFQQIQLADKCIVTTEKDYVKLLDSKLYSIVQHWPLFYIPITTKFLKDGNVFDKMILNSIKSYSN